MVEIQPKFKVGEEAFILSSSSIDINRFNLSRVFITGIRIEKNEIHYSYSIVPDKGSDNVWFAEDVFFSSKASLIEHTIDRLRESLKNMEEEKGNE